MSDETVTLPASEARRLYAIEAAVRALAARDADGERWRQDPLAQRIDAALSEAPPSERPEERVLAHYPTVSGVVPGFVDACGLVRLPESIRAVVRPPTLLTFGHFANGAMLVVPEHVMKTWEAEDETSRSPTDPACP